MDSQLPAALARRLAAYSATAGVALMVASEANAQVVYHDLDPDLIVSADEAVDLDFDDDGTPDLQFVNYVYNFPSCYSRGAFQSIYLKEPVYGGPGENSVLTSDYSALRLPTGYSIGPGPMPPRAFDRRGIVAYCGYSGRFGQFRGEEGYAGFRFEDGDGGVHYGWIRLAATIDATLGAAYAYAYEATPDTPIAAGAVSDALLSGAVNQTVFPPEGGLLAYTFTAENTTDEPQPLDLWIEAVGPDTLTLFLGSGTLAPGAGVTRTVEVSVGERVPAGLYEVDVKLGDFASRRFVTFERYEMVREAGAGATSEGGEGLTAEPFAGDLFAETDVVRATLGTHALGAPSPNPSTGQAALTLAVAEAQHVAVTVHDALGRRVAVLHDGALLAGKAHRLVFDGAGLPAGAYAVRAVGETFSDTRVVTLAR